MFERLLRRGTATPVPREQLTTADLQGRALLVDAIARIDQRVSGLEQQPPAAHDQAEAEAWQVSVRQSSSDIADGLEQLADVCERISERLEDHRRDSQDLREAIALLVSSRSPELGQPVPLAAINVVDVQEPRDELSPVYDTAEDDTGDDDYEEEDDEISLIDEERIDALAEHELTEQTLAENTVDHETAHSILEQLTEVLNRRGGAGDELRLRTRLRRASTSQWARLRDRGEDG